MKVTIYSNRECLNFRPINPREKLQKVEYSSSSEEESDFRVSYKSTLSGVGVCDMFKNFLNLFL